MDDRQYSIRFRHANPSRPFNTTVPSHHAFSSPSQPDPLATVPSNFNSHSHFPSVYRPAFPSPLASQRPLQASMSSSRTAPSVTPSTRTVSSSRSTSTSATSKFSINQAFSSIDQKDVAFFDQVISLLPRFGSDFTQIKKAYRFVLSSATEGNPKRQKFNSQDQKGKAKATDDDKQEWEAHLWACLLSLSKVRGGDWRERWDSVRLAIGLDPLSSEDEGEQSRSQDNDSSTTLSQSQDGNDSSTSTSQSQEGNDRATLMSPSQEGSDTSTSMSQSQSNDTSSSIDPEESASSTSSSDNQSFESYLETRPSNPTLPTSSNLKGNIRFRPGRNGSSRTVKFYDEEEDRPSLHSSSEQLGKQSRTLDWNATKANIPNKGKRRASDDDHVNPHRSDISTPRIQRQKAAATIPPTFSPIMIEQQISAIQSRLERLRTGGHRIQESDSDREQPAASTSNLPPSAKKRFDELVRHSQAERESMKRAQLARQEQEEEQEWQRQARRADVIFYRQLAKTFFKRWKQLSLRITESSQRAFESRNRFVLDQSWNRWRDSATKEQHRINSANDIDRVRCKLTTWRRWKRLTQGKVEQRGRKKKDQLRQAFQTFARRVKRRRLKSTYRNWRNGYLERVAKAVRKQHLLSGALAMWQIRWAQVNVLRAKELESLRCRRKKTLETTWTHWRRTTQLVMAANDFERERTQRLMTQILQLWHRSSILSGYVNAFSRRRLQASILEAWRASLELRRINTQQQALADRWKNRRTKKAALRHWRKKFRKVVKIHKQAKVLKKTNNTVRLRNAWAIWICKEREILLTRVQQGRKMEKALQHWRQKYNHIQTSLGQRETTIRSNLDRNKLCKLFEIWNQKSKLHFQLQSLAIYKDRELVQMVFLDIWRTQLDKRKVKERKAFAVREYFFQRSIFRVWIKRLQVIKLDRQIKQHDNRVLLRTFVLWKNRLRQRKKEIATVNKIQSKQNRRLQKHALTHWVEQVINRRNLEFTVGQRRERRLVRASFYAWVEASDRQVDMVNLMQSYVDVKQEEKIRWMFVQWLSMTRAHKNRREKTESFTIAIDGRLLTRVMEKWKDQFYDIILRPTEYELMLLRQKLAKARVLKQWMNRAKILPAIQFRSFSIKYRALDKWIKALPGAQRMSMAVKRDRHKNLKETFSYWLNVTKMRQQLRAAARFGGPSMVRLKAMTAKHGSPNPRSLVARAKRLSNHHRLAGRDDNIPSTDSTAGNGFGKGIGSNSKTGLFARRVMPPRNESGLLSPSPSSSPPLSATFEDENHQLEPSGNLISSSSSSSTTALVKSPHARLGGNNPSLAQVTSQTLVDPIVNKPLSPFRKDSTNISTTTNPVVTSSLSPRLRISPTRDRLSPPPANPISIHQKLQAQDRFSRATPPSSQPIIITTSPTTISSSAPTPPNRLPISFSSEHLHPTKRFHSSRSEKAQRDRSSEISMASDWILYLQARKKIR